MDFIQQLSIKRLRWIEANRENNFEDGIKNLLTELYPDNAHFIYELLQNAEDAKATKVKFVLTSKGLNFLHNGERQFTENDIESITSIGQSTKKDDFNQIGKFGVGFKAVFSYTQNPQIYSGKYAFEIHDLVCPREIPQIPPISGGKLNSTFFWFPFNHPQKPKDKAIQEIEKTLTNLPDNTILFLRNIKEIIWEIEREEKQTGYIKLTSLQRDNHFEIERRASDSQKTYWLRFAKPIPEKQGLFVSVAFRLEKIKGTDKFRIDNKVTKADVSIFFPAEKEDSGLKFYLNAPFMATIARDSIQNKTENEVLRDLLTDLLIESVSKIKEFEMLDRNFLEILPNNKDDLSTFYIPFREKIIKLFQNENYTPTWNNTYLPANKLIQANNEVKRVINNESLLNYLAESKDVDWSINAQRGSRVFDFLESLKIKEWSWLDLLYKVGSVFKESKKADEILSNLSNEWLQDFYVLLGKAKEETQRQYYDSRFPKIEDVYIVRLQDGNYNTGKNTYFQTEILKKGKNLSIVKPEVYQSSKDTNLNEKAKAFLKLIGVKEFEPKDEIKIILEKHYTDELNVTEQENIDHLRKFVKFWKDFPKEISIFSNYFILRTENEDKETQYYSKPSQTFIDEPYELTKLSSIESYLNEQSKWKLWLGYSTLIKNQNTFIAFLKDIGVTYKLEISEVTIWANPNQAELKQDVLKYAARETEYRINDDYNIENLDDLLSQQNYEVSRLVWETVSKADKKVIQARYRPNSSYQTRTAPSQLVHTLKQFAWIPDKEGKFHKPEEITREMLPDDFPFDNRNGWLGAIGVGTQAQRNKLEEQQKIERAAKQLGFESLEEAERAKEWIKMSAEEREEFEEFKQQKAIKEQFEDNNYNKTQSESSQSKTESGFTMKTDREKESNESDFSQSDNELENSESSESNIAQSIDLHKEDETNAENQEENRIRQRNISEYQKTQLVEARDGQGTFRTNVEKIENRCRLTDVNDKRFLIASHIKPWRKSTDEEKLDGNNGFLLSPHADKLFDRGWISFTDEGKILCTNDEVKEIMGIWGLDINKSVGSFSEEQKKYLAYHRENIFKSK